MIIAANFGGLHGYGSARSVQSLNADNFSIDSPAPTLIDDYEMIESAALCRRSTFGMLGHPWSEDLLSADSLRGDLALRYRGTCDGV